MGIGAFPGRGLGAGSRGFEPPCASPTSSQCARSPLYRVFRPPHRGERSPLACPMQTLCCSRPGGLTLRQIADRVGLSHETVRRRLREPVGARQGTGFIRTCVESY